MHRILGILIKMIPSETTAVSRQLSVAHELAHGTNALHHTFSTESETFYTTSKTDNLMDYNGGEYLNYKQWQWAHEKHRNVLGFLDDEWEGEVVQILVVYGVNVALNASIQMLFHLDEYVFTPSKGKFITFSSKDWSVKKAWSDMTKNKVYDKIRDEKNYISNQMDLEGIPMYKINKQWIEKMKTDGYTIIDIGNPLENSMESIFYNMEKGVMGWKAF